MNSRIRIGLPEVIITIVAFIFLVFNYTYVQQVPQVAADILFAILLIIGSMSIMTTVYVLKLPLPIFGEAPPVTEATEQNIFRWFLYSLIGSVLISVAAPYLTTGSYSYLAQSGLDTATVPAAVLTAIAVTYGILIANGEEWFFRGLIGSLLAARFNMPSIASVFDAVVFTAYHAYVYHDSSPALIAVFVGGFLIMEADIRTSRLLTGMLTHMTVNLLASGLQVIRPAALILIAFHFPLLLVLPMLALPTLLSVGMFLVVKKYKVCYP